MSEKEEESKIESVLEELIEDALPDRRVVFSRHPGRRYDDPKGILSRARNRHMIFTGSAGAVILSFITWFLNTQYQEKEHLKQDNLSQTVDLAKFDTRLTSLESKVDESIDTGTEERKELKEEIKGEIRSMRNDLAVLISKRPNAPVVIRRSDVEICHMDARGIKWSMAVSSDQAENHVKNHPADSLGACK